MSQKEITLNLKNLSIDQTKDFNACLIEHRKDFDQMLCELSKEKNLHLDIFHTSIFSREPEFSPLYERCCKLSFIKNQIQLGIIEEIITDDIDLYKVLKDSDILKSSNVNILCNEDKLRYFFRKFLPIKNLFRSFLFIVFMLLARRKERHDELDSKDLILISTNILKGSIEGNTSKAYSDRNFPNIADYLPKEARDRLVFLPQFPGGPRLFNKTYDSLRKNEQKFLIKADYYKLRDYLQALCYPFRINIRNISTIKYLDFNIRELILREFWQTCFDFKIIESLLNRMLPMRLKKGGIEVSIFIDWYENQLSSKGLISGFRINYPESKIIGYCGIIDSASYRINLHPSKYEKNQLLTPDKILIPSKDMKNNFMEFTKDLDIGTAPSLRYKYLHSISRLKKKDNRFIILVALPIFMDQSENILSVIAESLDAFQHMGDIGIHIKVHPTKSADSFKSKFSIESDNCRFINEDFFESIKTADLLVSAASTTCMEALAIGVPVAIIGARNKILQNPIPRSIDNDYWRICYSSDELLGFIETIQKINKDDIEMNLGQIKDSYFMIPTNENIQKLISIRS